MARYTSTSESQFVTPQKVTILLYLKICYFIGNTLNFCVVKINILISCARPLLIDVTFCAALDDVLMLLKPPNDGTS